MVDTEQRPGHDPSPRAFHAVLPVVVAASAPFADGLLALLAPWVRARLRLTCRALADAVPAGSCAPTLTAMVRAGGAGLLRWGAGDARPCWTHVLVAVEADAADALRWMCTTMADRLPDATTNTTTTEGGALLRPLVDQLQEFALERGSVASWPVLRALTPPATSLADAARLLRHAIRGGSRVLIAGCAATVADLAPQQRSPPSAAESHVLHDMLYTARNRGAVEAVLPFLRARPDSGYDTIAHHARLMALGMGQRALTEPYDWLDAVHYDQVLINAMFGGEVTLAAAALQTYDLLADDEARDYIMRCAMKICRNVRPMLEWAASALHRTERDLRRGFDEYADAAICADREDALRWLVERTGCGPRAHLLACAYRHGAAACVRYLVDETGLVPTRNMLLDALCASDRRALPSLVPDADAGPLGVSELVWQLGRLSQNDERLVCAVSALRRYAWLPPPGTELAEALGEMRPPEVALRYAVAAGYPVDADERAWDDFVVRHGPAAAHGEEEDAAHEEEDKVRLRWRLCAHELRALWHRHRDAI